VNHATKRDIIKHSKISNNAKASSVERFSRRRYDIAFKI